MVPVDDKNAALIQALMAGGVKRDAIHRGYYTEEMNPNDVDAIMRNKLKLVDADGYGMMNISGDKSQKKGTKWVGGSGAEHTLESIKAGWKAKFKKDITTKELDQVLINLKAK